ncbi:MAG: hypothetical protein ACFB20_03435 [Opitutales bacterium]
MQQVSEERRFYLVLGARFSGRRALLADMIDGGGFANASTLVLLSPLERADASPLEQVGAHLDTFNLEATGAHSAPQLQVPAFEPSIRAVFLLTDGALDPVDQAEAVRDWLRKQDLELTRVLTVIHGGLLSAHPELQRWYDACIHFSDVLILNRREGLPQRFLGDIKLRLRKQALPCLFELARRDSLENPPRVLEPQARRLSLIFDAADDDADAAHSHDDDDAFDDDAPEDAADACEEDTDPWLRRQSNGQREQRLPDITAYLPPASVSPSAAR